MLRAPEITFWCVWDGAALLGCGALNELDDSHGEIKSMHTAATVRGRGIGRAMLHHLLSEAAARGATRVSLETGSNDAFAAARALYADAGFEECEPFGAYPRDRGNTFMTLALGGGRSDD